MFVGREKELQTLEQAYRSDTFQMIVVYGRRRVGKTTLISQFCSGKRALFFTAQQQTDANNLSDFCREITRFFSLPEGTSFNTWDAAFSFLANQAAKEPFLFVFDEFPYAAQANRSIVSKLQVAIDHLFLKTRMCMVLCGSNQGFMESEVLGKKSPLHGRRTRQMRIRAFDYLDAAKMVPWATPEDAFKYYACIGGVPYYLSRIDGNASFFENIHALFFETDGLLFEEPQMLLRQELREPAAYNSILRAIASGAGRQSEIAGKAGLETTTIPKYLRMLISLDIVERTVPFGEDLEMSRRGLYRISDACYDFWFAFVAPLLGDIEAGAGRIAAESIPEQVIDTYLGRRFERVCRQWMLRESLAGNLSVKASAFGSWWGTNPQTKSQEDIDVIAAERFSSQALVAECKWRRSFNETRALEKLHARASLLRAYDIAGYYLFSRDRPSDATLARMARAGNEFSVTLEDLYAPR